MLRSSRSAIFSRSSRFSSTALLIRNTALKGPYFDFDQIALFQFEPSPDRSGDCDAVFSDYFDSRTHTKYVVSGMIKYDPFVRRVRTLPRNYDPKPFNQPQFDYLTDPTRKDSKEDYEIREVLKHTLKNGHWLKFSLSPEERRKVFSVFSEKMVSWDEESGKKLKPADPEYGIYYAGLVAWLEFLYAGIDEMPTDLYDNRAGFEEYGINPESGEFEQVPNARFHFETMLKEAVENVAQSRGEEVVEFDLKIETKPLGL